jgi:predicted transcriptional regulator YdeE
MENKSKRVALRVSFGAVMAFGLGALSFVAVSAVNMAKLHVDSFTVVGIETRTSNAREMSGDGPIGKLWAHLRSEDFLSRIPDRADSRVVALYTDYESDKDGPYTYVLGAKVSSAKDIPPGMVSRKVESGTYAMFTAQDRPPAQMVVDLWKQIWSLEKPDQIHRAYKTDFEVYDGGPADDPSKAHVAIYVGLKPGH